MNGDVQFKEDWKPHVFVYKKSWGQKLCESIIKHSGGLIKNEQTAGYIILVLAISIIIISIYLFLGAEEKINIPDRGIYTDDKTPPKTYEKK